MLPFSLREFAERKAWAVRALSRVTGQWTRDCRSTTTVEWVLACASSRRSAETRGWWCCVLRACGCVVQSAVVSRLAGACAWLFSVAFKSCCQKGGALVVSRTVATLGRAMRAVMWAVLCAGSSVPAGWLCQCTFTGSTVRLP